MNGSCGSAHDRPLAGFTAAEQSLTVACLEAAPQQGVDSTQTCLSDFLRSRPTLGPSSFGLGVYEAVVRGHRARPRGDCRGRWRSAVTHGPSGRRTEQASPWRSASQG